MEIKGISSKQYEPSLSINDFNRPKILEDREAISSLLIQLILLEPGTYSNRPTLGVGLRSRYRFNDEASLSQLRRDIADQISTFLPEFQAVDVNVYMDTRYNNEIIIEIAGDGVIYKYESSQQNSRMNLRDLI